MDLALRRLALFVLLAALSLAGCHQGYSPNTYASSAAQVEANVQRGTIIGVRQVLITANGTVGAATGGAVGGVAGAQVPGAPVVTALGAIGGTLVGGIGGTVAAQAVADTKGWEYIVQESGGQLVSVTQTSKTALPIGLRVLVIAGSQQARIVPDYTVQMAPAPKPAVSAPAGPVEVRIGPLPPVAGSVVPFQVAPVVNDPATTPAPAPAPAPAPGAAAKPAPAPVTPVASISAPPAGSANAVTP